MQGGCGFPMGPFAMSDLAGLDIGWKEETSSSSTVREVLCENGRRGQKNGRGYYTYDPETRAATPDPEVVELIKNFAVGKGIEMHALWRETVACQGIALTAKLSKPGAG